MPHLGTWKGHSRTTRTGVYGSTITEADTTATLEMNKDGQLVQVCQLLVISFLFQALN